MPSDAAKVVAETCRKAKNVARGTLVDRYNTAVDYSEGRQLDDVEAELSSRYKNTQGNAYGVRIQPFALPLTQRFIEEQANLYSSGVDRILLNDANDADAEASERLNRACKSVALDQVKSQVEQKGTLLKSCGLLYQQDYDGAFAPEPFWPQNIMPIPQEHGSVPYRSETYDGFILRSRTDESDATEPSRNQYTLVQESGFLVYEAKVDDPAALEAVVHERVNPYAPLMPLRVWHPEMPSEIIPETDVPIVQINRELNLLWSAVLTTFRYQHGAVLHRQKGMIELQRSEAYGPMFPFITNPDEAVAFLQSGVSWAEIREFLQSIAKIALLFESVAPGDFSLEGRSVASGFAKKLDMLPQLRSRAKRETWAVYQEEQDWPLLREALNQHDSELRLPDNLRLRANFGQLEIPYTVQERNEQNLFDLEHGITTPAKILSEEKGISLDEAQAQIEENAESQKPKGLAALIGQRGNEDTVKDPEPAEIERERSVSVELSGEIDQEPKSKSDTTPQTALNGGQIKSMMDIITAVVNGSIPYESAIVACKLSFNLDEEDARALLEPAKDEYEQREQRKADAESARRDRPGGGFPQEGGPDGGQDDQQGPPGGDQDVEREGEENLER